MVEFDISRGLPANVEILCKERLFVHKLDYQGIPFRCSICRDTGHLRRQCSSSWLASSSPVRRSSRDNFLEDKVCTSFSSIPAIEQLKNACNLFDDVSDQELAFLDSVGNKSNPLDVKGPHKVLVFS